MPDHPPPLIPQEALDPASFGVLITDNQLRLLQFNAWALKHLTPHLDQMLLRPLDEIFPELVERDLLSAYRLALNSRQTLLLSKPAYSGFFRIPHPRASFPAQQSDPSPLPGSREMEQELTIYPFIQDGKVSGLVTLIMDVTDWAEAERSLVRTNHNLQIINEIDQALALLPQEQSLKLLLQRSLHLLSCEAAMLLVRQGDELVMRQCETTHGRPNNSQLAGWVFLNRRQTVNTYKIDGDNSRMHEAAVPLLRNGDLLGVLAVQTTRPSSFSSVELIMLEGLASRVAGILISQQSFEKDEKARRSHQVLNQVLEEMRRTTGLRDRLAHLFTQMHEMLPFDSGLILVTQNRRCHVLYQYGYEKFQCAGAVAQLEATLDEFVNLRIIQSTQTHRIIANTANDPLWQPLPNIPHVRSWIGAPIHCHGKVSAFLSLDNAQIEAFAQADPNIISLFTSLLGLILESACSATDPELHIETC